MSFIIVLIDKEDPAKSEIVPVEETEEQLLQDEPPELDCQLFPTENNAKRWVAADELECPGQYDYHIIQVG